jgi:NADH-quinone oxidoreductase subunit J
MMALHDIHVAAGSDVQYQELGMLLYTQYIYPLEVAAAVLLVAMIAAIALTLRARKDSKYVSPG